MTNKSNNKKHIRWVAVSGGFDPIHVGHIELMQKARKLGDRLLVILNNDHWLRSKKGFAFMPEKERKMLLLAFPFVDRVYLTGHGKNDPRGSAYHRGVSRELQKLKPAVFANGGDRDKKNAADPRSSLYWDIKTCGEYGIQMKFNLGKKIQSSSWMIKDAARALARSGHARPSRKRGRAER